jgi:hypothetical protein
MLLSILKAVLQETGCASAPARASPKLTEDNFRILQAGSVIPNFVPSCLLVCSKDLKFDGL